MGADVAIARVLDPERQELVVRAVVAPSAALGVELEGARFPLDELPGEEEVKLEDAPAAVRLLAERLGAAHALVLPVDVSGEVVASLELLSANGPFGERGRVVARIAATQVGLAVRAFAPAESQRPSSLIETVRAAGDALAAAADAPHTQAHVLRLALELSGAEGALLWRGGGGGRLSLAASAGRAKGVARPVSVGEGRSGDRVSLAYQLGEPLSGLLQLVFAPGHQPSAELVDTLHGFAVRAADVLRENEAARGVESELEQTRALLAVVGEAAEQLSVTHTLETALARVAELVGVERLAVYLLEEGRLTTAAERGLAGPHPRAAQALLDLALGPYRGRGMLVVPDAAAEPRLAEVADAVAEAGIEGAIALPLLVGEEVTGLLCVYSPRGRPVEPDHAPLLSAVAGRLAVAVQNAQLHEEATRLGKELEQALASERAAARRLGALYEISRAFGGSAIQRVFRAGEPLELDVATAAELGGSHALLVPFLEKGSTAVIVPVATPAEVLASLTLISLQPDRPIDRETIDAALAIGGQAALAIDNARLYQQQKDFADAMQRALLPQVRPPVEGIDIGEVYAPSAFVEVGGDLYDYLALDDGRLAVVVGDVTGHGIDAAADMAMAKYVFRSLAREHPEPADFLAAANDVVVGEIAAGKFITMLDLLIDPRTGAIACGCAGHPPPRLVDAGGTVGSIEAKGLALGVDAGVSYHAVDAQLDPTGSVVLYTDGVIEARRAGELYGVERLDALLARRYALRAEDIAASVIQSARRFTGGELADDCAVVVLKRR